MKKRAYAGFVCSYTPLAVIDAAGLIPFRIFPETDSPQHAGTLLHDNVCPHVKKIIDRAMSGDIPDNMETVIFMNSCDAMRRASDAWKKAKPDQKVILLDLPQTRSGSASAFFSGELKRAAAFLAPDTQDIEAKILESQTMLNAVAKKINHLKEKNRSGKLKNGSVIIQKAYNFIASNPPGLSLEYIDNIIEEESCSNGSKTKLFLMGNMLHSPEAFQMFEDSGISITDDDICTGSRFISKFNIDEKDVFTSLADEILSKPPCARTFDSSSPGSIGVELAGRVKISGADGAIMHVMKFCDPYLSRIPIIRDEFKKQNIPLLILEGDTSLGSIGQQKTRIEAFIEMLG